LKNGVFWLLRRVALVRTDVSEEHGASFIRVTKIGELGTTYQVFLRSVRRLLVAACVLPSSPIFVTLMKEAPGASETRFLQEPHGVTTQKTPFFIVSAVKTSNLTFEKIVLEHVGSSTPHNPMPIYDLLLGQF
jgi:hypothetical protein